MREIKFRAWDKFRRKMCSHEDIKIRDRFMEDDMSNQYAPLMQYTGLHDKNGKEIYEGDIVKCVSETHSNLGKYPTGKFDTRYYKICGMEEDAYCFGTREIGKEYISIKLTLHSLKSS